MLSFFTIVKLVRKLKLHVSYCSACALCTPNATNACQCVLADGVERGILVFNRQLPGPSIQVKTQSQQQTKFIRK